MRVARGRDIVRGACLGLQRCGRRPNYKFVHIGEVTNSSKLREITLLMTVPSPGLEQVVTTVINALDSV